MNYTQPTPGEGTHTLLKRVFLIGATLLVVAGLAFVLVMALAPQALPVGDVRNVQPTLAPIESMVDKDQEPGGFRPAPAPAISYATPVYIEANNHSACNAQKIELPFSGSQSASSEYNIYRFYTRTPALRISLNNYNNVGEVLIYEVIEDTCSTTGKMSVRFVTSTELKTSVLDADIVDGLAAGTNYLLAIHTRGRLNSEIYSLVVNEIEAPATTTTPQATPMPTDATQTGKTAGATSTSSPAPTAPPLPDAEFVLAAMPTVTSGPSQPSAPSNQPAPPAVQPANPPASAPTTAPTPLPLAATATTRPTVVATRVIVLPTSEPADTATPQSSATPAPSATSAASSTPRPTNTSQPSSTPRPTNTSEPTRTPRPTSTPSPTDTPKPTKEPKHPTTEPTAAAPTTAPPTAESPTTAPTQAPPTVAPTAAPTQALPTTAPPTAEPATAVPPTPKHEPKPTKEPKHPTPEPTVAAPTAEPPTAEPPTAAPPTTEPPTAAPTQEIPTAAPPTAEPPPTTLVVIENTPAPTAEAPALPTAESTPAQ